MAFRLVTSARRRLRSTICAQFIPREARINVNRLGAETEFISKAEPKPDIFLCRENFGMFGAYLVEEDGTFTMSPKYNKYPPSFMEGYVHWTSCDGLIYIKNTNPSPVLWNPTTHEYKFLPQLPPRLEHHIGAWGMWHDHTSQDYKVVNLVEGIQYPRAQPCYVNLYSLKTNSWKRIPCPASRNFSLFGSHVCFSGFFYHTIFHAILSFHISTETFSTIPFPKGCYSYLNPHILEYKGLLSVVYSDDEAYHLLREYQIWVMRDGSWTREFVFRTRGVADPLWFSKDGKLLYFESQTHDIVVFDCATGKSKHLGLNFPAKMIPFVENFVQLNGISYVEKPRNYIKSGRNPLNSVARLSSSSTPIFSSLKDGMAFRLVTSATRQLPLCSRVRSTISFSGSRAQFTPRVAVNTRIDGAPPMKNNGSELGGHNGQPDVFVSETRFHSYLRLWKEDICPKPKPDIFVKYGDYYRDKYNYENYFVAYSLKEDGTISPKYFIYPPSFVAENYTFTAASCNGLLHFVDRLSGGQALWNPTTGGYKILPKPYVELRPHLTYIHTAYGMWFDHRFEDYKVLNLITIALHDERGNLVGDPSDHIYLYSLKLNSWKRIPCTDFCCSPDGEDAACVAGGFYCEGSPKGKDTCAILSFDFSTETLSTLPLPLPEDNCDRYYFLDYKGLLSVLACWWDCDLANQVPRKYELWIMSDGLWTRVSVFHVHGVSQPLWFSQDGKLLYFASMDDEIVMFDRTTGELNHLGVDCFPDVHRSPTMIPFFESFVQLN